MTVRACVLVGLMAVLAACWADGAEFVWMESENPTRQNIETPPADWQGSPVFSEGEWLGLTVKADEVQDALPQKGAILTYEFEAPSAGRYEAWNRVGMESISAPFDWRIDDGQWETIEPRGRTTDLTRLGFWSEIAWMHMGDADLGAGKHTIQIRLKPWFEEKDGKKVAQRIIYRSDALCVHKGEFHPNGKHKPGEDWRTEKDREAAENIFEFPADADADSPGRIELPLGGLWQICRHDEGLVENRTGPTKTLPKPEASFWRAIEVPSNQLDRDDLAFAHRTVYRARVNVPAEMKGRSFFLHMPSLSLIASVHVNGQFCGWTKAPFALFECDLTPAIKPGEVNEICVVIKDVYYAISEEKYGENPRMAFVIPRENLPESFVTQFFDFPVGRHHYADRSGILEEPSLVVAGGPVYTTDVFAQPSVKDKELTLQVSLLNPSGADRTVQVAQEILPFEGGAAEKTFAPREVTVPAGEEITFEMTEDWRNPRLWWPDDPNQYYAVTKVMRDGRVLDQKRTKFGFREWTWDGRDFTLNGVPWYGWADTTREETLEESLATWREHGQNLWRFWGETFCGENEKEVLDFMDRNGMVVRRSGIFNGAGANYLHKLASGPELFDNWLVRLKAQVKQERNHPSILIWSIENEIAFINSRNLGLTDKVEPHISRVGHAIMDFDPTRPVMVDGGNCLKDNSLPVNGVHYIETDWRYYPDEAYTLDRAYQSHEEATLGHWGTAPWELVPDRPIFMGEAYYVQGNQPSDFAQFVGEGAFVGWGPAAYRGAGLLGKMIYEGYRWHGVDATHVWAHSFQMADLHHNSWQPVCVFCRQWNWTFGGGSEVARTLKVFNDTHYDDPIEAGWELVLDGKKVAAERRTFRLDPGQHEEYEITVRVPEVGQRTEGQFILTCRRGGKEVFREVKDVAVLNTDAGPKPGLPAAALAVMDPHGTAVARLKARGVPFTQVASLDDIPDSARVILIGKDALDARTSTDPRWLSLAGEGKVVLALEQEHPLHYQAIPADLGVTDFAGRVAFMEAPDNPVFNGLEQQDFFTWSEDHIVYRNVYSKATTGATSLAHCDERLGYSAIASCPVNEGLMLLCQMVVGEKLETDPVAMRLFDNMLARAATYRPIHRDTAVIMDPADERAKLLQHSGLKYDASDDLLGTVRAGRHRIVLFDATPANLKALANHVDVVKGFTSDGGWLMAWGLTPEGLEHFNRIVGVEHIIRPFRRERVTLSTPRDPLAAGITVRDVAMESAEKIFNWMGTKYMVDDEFTCVVDLDRIERFALFGEATAGGEERADDPAAAQWNAINGFTSDDAWKLILYVTCAQPTVSFRLPRPETITDFSIALNTHYGIAQKVNLYLDDAEEPVSFDVEPKADRQDFHLDRPRKAQKITIELADFDKVGKTTGIDNVWIKVRRTPEWYSRVKPLLNVGGLVRYPMGDGGLVLNQLNIQANEPVPENAQKKQGIVTSLLRNLHAQFSGGRMLTLGNLSFQTVSIHEKCNQFTTAERGWFRGNADISHAPAGRVRLAGVPYDIVDFRTSPVPSCIMLGGNQANGDLPEQVNDIPIGRKADCLFFLHTYQRARTWRRRRNDKTPPPVFVYVVHYADGQTETVPILYQEGAGHWLTEEPQGLQDAALAWAARPEGKEETPYAALYSYRWRNPRPDVAIRSVDMKYDDDAGSRWGTPALLAITAGTEAE